MSFTFSVSIIDSSPKRRAKQGGCGIALIVYQLGLLAAGAGFTLATAVALIVLILLVYMLVRKNRYSDNVLTVKSYASK